MGRKEPNPGPPKGVIKPPPPPPPPNKNKKGQENKMKLLTRIKNFIAAGTTNLIDTLENSNPNTTLTMAQNEVEEFLKETRAEFGKLTASNISMEKSLSEMEKEYKTLDTQIETAVKEGRDDLAKTAISRQMDLNEQSPIIQQKIKENVELISQLENSIQALLAKKREIISKKDLVEKKDTVEERVSKGINIEERAEYVQELLDRSETVKGGGTTLTESRDLIELKELQHNHDVNIRLEAIKQKLSKD